MIFVEFGVTITRAVKYEQISVTCQKVKNTLKNNARTMPFVYIDTSENVTVKYSM